MGIKVYRLSDRLKLKIGELTFEVAPMTYGQKLEVSQAMTHQGGEQLQDVGKATYLTIKYSVKNVTGIVYPDGSKWKPRFEEDGTLTNELVEELLSLHIKDDLIFACISLMSDFGGKVKNPTTGEELKGVEIVQEEGLPKKK